MILVTGGTGLLGSHLLYKLAQTETKVRALYRREDTLEAVKHVFSYFTKDIDALFSKIEWVKGDILNIPLLDEQFHDISEVYHCAALVSFDPNDYYKLRKINIEGTANIVNLCISHKVKKLCYVSSVAAMGEEKSGIKITEESPWNPESDLSDYAITKYGAEMEVWRGTQEGLDVVIVNPGIILGGGFWRSGSGSLLKRVFKGMPYYTNGIMGFVDVVDVCKIMIALMQSTIKNERFIVVAENLSFKDFVFQVAKHLKVKTPQKEAKAWHLKMAWRLDWLRHKLKGKRRRLTKQMSKSVNSVTVYDNKKLIKAIAYKYRPVKTTIEALSRQFLIDGS